MIEADERTQVTTTWDILPSPEIPGTPPGSSEITLLYLIKQVELAIRARLDVAIRDEGLTVVQYTALRGQTAPRSAPLLPDRARRCAAALASTRHLPRARDPRRGSASSTARCTA